MSAIETSEYTGLARDYRSARPAYPLDMARTIAEFAGDVIVPGAVVIDVGAGTGISTMAVANALPPECAVIGVEPDDDMRAHATASLSLGSQVTFVAGSAEDMPIGDQRAAVVTAGQAIQWFDRLKFYAEVTRVLGPRGVFAIFENNRDWRNSAFLDEHETFLEQHSIRKDGVRYSRSYREHPYAQEMFELIGNVRACQFAWQRDMTIDDFLVMAKSSAQVQRALSRLGTDEGLQTIRAYSERHADSNGLVKIPYVTRLYMARKSPIVS
jgi:ubiquinone/menaquinone biosynthesis C-methylase UbiE